MNSRTLREAARAALPEGAFLRRDRGEALFVTDAPRVAPGANWPSVLARAGFLAAERGGLLCLTPDSAWHTRLEDACPAPPDALCRGLFCFAGREIEAESLALFAAGARVLGFERRLRQRAAACLRTQNPASHGGGLYACALLNHLIKEARS